MKMPSYSGDFETFVNYFMNDHLEFLPYFPHILDAWAKRTHPNLLFLFYEDMKKLKKWHNFWISRRAKLKWLYFWNI
ncbi:putative Sulfotransferase family cytosolic 1B member [Daphnia magna]|uniref:Putative Sulfotransferase family cytosolic 1B member n=1 Tax=Daphnia magna TaxID=35525 RepID=A0A164ZD27_9CRUS|nr:putative Sulfotransferase family cytosolic 1B member [Daphnia magna]